MLVALHALADVCKKLCVGRLYLEYTKDNGVEAAKTESVQLMQVAKLMGEEGSQWGLSVEEEAAASAMLRQLDFEETTIRQLQSGWDELARVIIFPACPA